MKNWILKYSAYLAWAIALTAMVGSLYFSEIAGYAPCVLCWYQRILMYPLVAVIAVGILRRDTALWTYALPLSIGGLVIACYHSMLQYGVISEALSPCTFGVPCVTEGTLALNFVTIPLLSVIAFALITALMLMNRASKSHE